MTATVCPDWRRLAADRLDRRAARSGEPAGWPEALAHLDGCSGCRREALAADPTLVFRRLPAVEMTSGQADAEADRVRQAVAAMRVASRLGTRPAYLSPKRGWRQWSAAAALVAASLVFGSRGGVPEGAAVSAWSDAGPAWSAGWSAAPSRPSGRARTVAPARLVEPSRPPLVEGVNRPEARVYQFDGEDLSVVFIVDETLDV